MSPKIHAEFWTDPDLEDVGPEVRLVVLWLITNPMVRVHGAFVPSLKRFAFETGLSREWLEEALNALPRMFVRSGEWVWARTFVGHQYGRGPKLAKNNIAKSAVAQVWELPSDLQDAFWSEYPELEALTKPLPSPMQGDDKGLGSGSDLPGLNGESGKMLPVQSPYQALHKPLPSPTQGERTEQNREGTEKEQNQGMGSGEGDGGHRPPLQEEGARPALRYDLAAECLNFLGEKTGADFSRAAQAVLWEVALRLHEVKGDVPGVKKMVGRQCEKWLGNGKMAEFLRPATLFESVKFHNYYGQRDLPVAVDGEDLVAVRKHLQERIETSRANKQSTWYAADCTEEDRAQLKKWRGELAGVNERISNV